LGAAAVAQDFSNYGFFADGAKKENCTCAIFNKSHFPPLDSLESVVGVDCTE
jgi:hypothetical protein